MADKQVYDRSLVELATGANYPLLLHDNGDGTYSLVVYGGGAVLTNLEKAEDAAHVSGDKGIQLLAVRKDTAAALAGTDGDYIPLIVDSEGRLYTSPPQSGFNASATLTRTNDTNAYAANDVIGSATGSTAALTFASMGPSAGRILIIGATLEIDASAIISGETSYTLHLYDVTPPSALGDNAAWDLPSGDRSSYLGSIDLGTPVDVGSTLWVEKPGSTGIALNKPVKLAGTSLFAYLVTVGAYTPTASRVHKVTLHAVAL